MSSPSSPLRNFMNQTRTSAFTCERPDALDSYRPSGSNVGKRVAELNGVVKERRPCAGLCTIRSVPVLFRDPTCVDCLLRAGPVQGSARSSDNRKLPALAKLPDTRGETTEADVTLHRSFVALLTRQCCGQVVGVGPQRTRPQADLSP
uniref:Uncharacterized protein n=1 Tax=Rangifer tarandus platyrhynchus TaxID=3082113 RepID=A0ACB0EZR1_RANTA|nr:unnamed protein product [Rangifer tarandus platyrhynchus]